MQVIKVAVLVYCLVSCPGQIEGKCKDDNVCVQMKTHGMWSADCYDGRFKNFPQCLRSDVEIIDLSYNRLRRLSRKDLSRYTSLKILYLADNMLANLENSTFQDMDRLQTLDLSLNGISKLPPVVFHLPSLKRLYLSQNQNINVAETADEARPITSPLEALDIGFSDLEALPNLGVMPYLWFYNISGNNLLDMKTRDFAGLCSLKQLVNGNSSVTFSEPCDCWNVQRWLRERGVKFGTMTCEVEMHECPYNISKEDMSTFNECRSRYSELELKSVFVKVGIGVGVVALVLLLLLLYFLYRRRKQRRPKIASKSNNSFANDKKENQGLL